MRTLAELLGFSPPFGNPAPPPPFADWLFSGAGTPYPSPPWTPELNDLSAPANPPAPDFSTGGILGAHLAARAAESNGFGGILGPVAGMFSSSPEPTGPTTASGSDPLAMSFGQNPFGPAAGNAFGAPPGLNFDTPPGLNQHINLPWSPQPASSPQSARPTIGWDETFPPAYRSLGLPDIRSLQNSGAGRDPEALHPWLPGDVALGKLGAYRDVGDPYPSNGAVDQFANAPTNLSPVISDAAEDSWIPGARYAQARGRRGGGRIGQRELSAEEAQNFDRYHYNLRVLRDLDPQNRLLTTQNFTTRDWIPSRDDNYFLQRELDLVRRRGGFDLERHHLTPLEFAARFRACGIEPHDYIAYLPAVAHRLRPDGLHTGPNNWNSVWRRYFQEHGSEDTDSEAVLRQLIQMWDSAPWLKR
jgi:hypothetical protein